MTELTTLLDGLYFGEGPRWRNGCVYLSDFYAHEVLKVDLNGKRERVAHVPNQPSGLGWLPDGTMLIVSMKDRKLLHLTDNVLVEYADLSSVAGYHCNDMVVSSRGHAYVGNFGYDHYNEPEEKTADLARVDLDGSVHRAATGLRFPNGSVITPDGKILVVGETRGKCLTAWDIGPNGALSNRRVWADLEQNFPDGICLDAEGAIWVADPRLKETIRVREGGEVTQRISTGDYGSYACMLGGDDRRTLFICTAAGSGPGAAREPRGRIEFCRVDVPGAGLP
ncbi:MAG: SMP-30/gluconolactonase/LRE family protein [Pseudomonadales bacterium]|nr:SMP-30/gluconolactonase/LRE family protein [Pseudomonadales bacterium]MDP6470152.1 SMP-30/gluconolactonase/LRE family protein [Pseudomonadales bacterium]MDP6827058.1 SMP-30/gluconolactonase/LRE family protein [Pseudomonadales bacterium]MDP6972585.1 SMP-30/gluconolactonase/LRE family protein [Pseudomonadales bacterium]